MSQSSVHIVQLEQWSIYEKVYDGTTAPELRERVLCGLVYGHPKKLDGHEVKTSPITSLNDEGVATTWTGTVYKLGVPQPAYLRAMRQLGVQPNMPVFFRRLIGGNEA